MQFSDTSKTFGPFGSSAKPATVTVQANGGNASIYSVMDDGTIEVLIENGSITADAAFSLKIANSTFRIAATGGAVVNWNA